MQVNAHAIAKVSPPHKQAASLPAGMATKGAAEAWGGVVGLPGRERCCREEKLGLLVPCLIFVNRMGLLSAMGFAWIREYLPLYFSLYYFSEVGHRMAKLS